MYHKLGEMLGLNTWPEYLLKMFGQIIKSKYLVTWSNMVKILGQNAWSKYLVKYLVWNHMLAILE